MSVVMTPATSDPNGAYLATPAARTRGAVLAAMPGVPALLSSDDATLAALLLAASIDIDSAMRYQGLKYAPDQVREFPRYRDATADRRRDADTGQYLTSSPVWDWDSDAGVAVVPQAIQDACIIQAAWINASPEASARLDAIRSGLAAQSIGSLSETYLTPSSLPGGFSGLCNRAQQLCERYRLKTGGLL